METCQRDNHPETREGSRLDLVLSTHKSAGHGLQADKILLTRILSEISGRGLLRNKQFGIRPKRSKLLQLASSFEEYPGTLKEEVNMSGIPGRG